MSALASERLWVLVLAATTFLAGAAGGVLFGVGLHEDEPAGPLAAYRVRMAETFSLDEVGVDRLEEILAVYDQEIEALKARQLRALEPELIVAGETARERIRRYVIPADRLDDFDRWATPEPLAAPTPQ